MQTRKIDYELPAKLLPVFESDKRYNILYGGRGGAKSWTIAFLLITRALKNRRLILCTREVQNTIRDSVHRLLSDTIYRYELDNYFDIKKTEIDCKTTGSQFIFKGLSHNISEIKSTEGIDDCWLEEANKTSRDSLDVLIPTVRKEGSQFWIVYNPENDDDPVHHDFVINKRPDSLVININYEDNPYFPEVLRREMEYDRANNYDKYQHVWMGQTKKITDACIFKGKFVVEDFETPNDVDFYFGADWGSGSEAVSNDPYCLTRCFIKDQYLYIDYESYGIGVELEELEQFYDNIPLSRKYPIRADNTRGDTISYLKRKGFMMIPGEKGRGSVEEGIEFMRSFKKIVIHPRCKNTIYEFKSYSYKKDKLTNEILNIIIDKDNHTIDSIRYSLEKVRKGIGAVKVPIVSAYELGL